MNNYTFKKPFTTKIGSAEADLMMPGSIPLQILEFKVGDKIQGAPSEDGKSIVAMPRGNAYVNIPTEFLSTSTSTLFDPNEYGGGANPNGMYINKPIALKPTSNETDLELSKKIFLDNEDKTKEMIKIGRLNLLAKLATPPIALYAFSKFNGYDNKKTAKVTIIGSVIIIGAIILNGFSGAWSGNSFMDRTFGKQNFW